MKKPLLIIIFSCTLLFLETYPVIILVHGTFASDAFWCNPGGKFYQELSFQATKLNQKLVTCCWSGSLSIQARIEGAKKLAQMILEYKNYEKTVIVIGHSHGGNVINLASNLLYHIETNSNFSKIQDILAFSDAYKELNKFRNKSFDNKYLIDMAYLLATPINTKLYTPNMKIIKYLCNLYSLGDRIQTVLGLYNKMMKKIERTVNLEVMIQDFDIFNYCPNHFQMHHPIIAKYILSIPFILQENMINNFENFKWRRSARIYFQEDNFPEYSLNITRNSINLNTENSTIQI